MTNTLLVTGSGGLVGSECIRKFSSKYDQIIGIDNNLRQYWFGHQGSTHAIIGNLTQKYKNYKHFYEDVRSKFALEKIIEEYKPKAIIHCAGQPSHDKSAEIPGEDFDVNAVGTINLLEAVRKLIPDALFVFLSTNKVYGNNTNRFHFIEQETRYELVNFDGFDESLSLDCAIHSPFGVSKTAADLMVQEYNLYYGLKTVCFRCGCITGKNQKGVEQHGFLNYLCWCITNNKEYNVYGFKGKQVRDNIHVSDLVNAFEFWLDNPNSGVYNIGGGIENSCSIIEIANYVKEKNRIVELSFHANPRIGDHIYYTTNYKKFSTCYPQWKINYPLVQILNELLDV